MSTSVHLVRIGTSGLVLREKKSSFPQQYHGFSRLAYYSTLFNSIEINSSFYRLHKPQTFGKWSDEVLGDFKFTVKVWKEITHRKNLIYTTSDIARFMATLQIDPARQGCLLIQFPASINNTYLSKVDDSISLIENHASGSCWNLSVEFRNNDWYQQETVDMIRRHNVSIVMHDMPKSKNTITLSDSRVVYLRFHGSEGDYRGSYGDEFIATHSRAIKDWVESDKEVYVYFNNTIGNAYENALLLGQQIKEVALQKS